MLDFNDNRLSGLINEIREVISQECEPEVLRRFGIELHILHHEARGKAWDVNPKKNKTY